jgi:hypothetical protein
MVAARLGFWSGVDRVVRADISFFRESFYHGDKKGDRLDNDVAFCCKSGGKFFVHSVTVWTKKSVVGDGRYIGGARVADLGNGSDLSARSLDCLSPNSVLNVGYFGHCIASFDFVFKQIVY